MKLSRRGFLKALAQVGVASGLGSLGLYEYSLHLEPDWLCVEETIIPIKDLGPAFDGFRIAQLSDLHLSSYTEIDLIEKATETVNQLEPDLTVLTGDYVLDGAESIFDLSPILARLNARHGVYAILGNHDYWTNADIVLEGIAQSQIPLLMNSGLPIHIGQQAIYLAGLIDGWSLIPGVMPDLEAALKEMPSEIPVILLMHEPDYADKLTQDSRVSLQLSGHSHGGQVRLPIMQAPILPLYGRKYDQGLYRVNQSWLYVNRGIGVVPPPVRFNCRPEISLITLTCM